MRREDPLSTESLRARLREAGLRATAARVAVLRALVRATMPRSHADVCDEVAELGYDRATVYRNLIDLTEAGLARRLDLGDHVWRFERVPGDPAEPGHGTDVHPHFVCNECGTVECLPAASVAIRGVPRALRKNRLQVQLSGLCEACA
jgi:Fur family ferric uptake transcriptional regulator